MENLLEIENLTVELMSTRGIVYALSGVDMTIRPGEIHGVVGESGCGKSMTAKSILRLHNPQRSRMRGSIRFEGRELLTLPNREIEKLRGSAISMIFQDPMTSLNPLMTIGDQIADMYRYHAKVSKAEARDKAQEMLSKVGIEPAAKRCRQYPFELSGGMQQRVMIAMALAHDPDLVIADEPTTALDVVVQAQVLELMRVLRREHSALLLITHDMGVVWQMATRVAVMYAGEIVESAPAALLFGGPRHPYTRGLLAALPSAATRGRPLPVIPGQVPSPLDWPSGCRFHDRCPLAFARCAAEHPRLVVCGEEHRARCFRAAEGGGPR